MRRAPALAVVPTLALLALAGCGSSGETVASDPAPTTSSPTSAPTSSAPTASPTVGTYPAFPTPDYRFQLTASCFCVNAGTPIEVTVVGGRVSAAAYAADVTGRGAAKAGDPVDPGLALTIDDVIDLANDTSAAKVRVEWPAGQDYPSSVYVDHDRKIADDEIGYTVSDVQVG